VVTDGGRHYVVDDADALDDDFALALALALVLETDAYMMASAAGTDVGEVKKQKYAFEDSCN
jgi:hypothetical protein